MGESYSVYCGDRAEVLPGKPTAELVAKSLAEGGPEGTGLVYACCEGGWWCYVWPNDVAHYRMHLGVEVRTVYVAAVERCSGCSGYHPGKVCPRMPADVDTDDGWGDTCAPQHEGEA
jgi:hypothetical protein